MASNEPYGRLVGTVAIYLAAAGEAIPDLDAAPAGNWVRWGKTDGDQKIKVLGGLELFQDNETIGNTKAVRPDGGVEVSGTMVEMTLEHIARGAGDGHQPGDGDDQRGADGEGAASPARVHTQRVCDADPRRRDHRREQGFRVWGVARSAVYTAGRVRRRAGRGPQQERQPGI